MSIGFKTRSKYYNRYLEASYAILKKVAGRKRFKRDILPDAKKLRKSTKGAVDYGGTYKQLYKRNYFNGATIDALLGQYGLVKEEQNYPFKKQLRRWGFKYDKSYDSFPNNPTDRQGGPNTKRKYDVIHPPYNKKYPDQISSFRPVDEVLRIDVSRFGLKKKSASFKVARNRKSFKKMQKKNVDFIYYESNGFLYFNENGKGKGFGDGGTIAVLRQLNSSIPEIDSSNIRFI